MGLRHAGTHSRPHLGAGFSVSRPLLAKGTVVRIQTGGRRFDGRYDGLRGKVWHVDGQRTSDPGAYLDMGDLRQDFLFIETRFLYEEIGE